MKRYSILPGIVLAMLGTQAFSEPASFTQGPAKTTDTGLFNCEPLDPVGVAGTTQSKNNKAPIMPARISAVGTIQSEDGKTWTVPAETQYKTATKAADLYNECTGNVPADMSEVDLNSIPVFDAGGTEEFVAYIFADNYFELYVNGQFLAADSVPFTPFNSNIVRFKANRPVTLALKLVDWEEHLGLGTETNPTTNSHPGDGGITIHVKNKAGETVALSDESWRAQTFYTSPLREKSCLKIVGTRRDSSACDTSDAKDDKDSYGAHWVIPDGWMKPDFHDADWPYATTFTNETVGVSNKPGFMNFTDVFDAPGADAQFIWSSSLILDNLVLIRKTID
jgi:hypothetical protein